MKKEQPQTIISNNTFTGVHWDAKAIETVEIVAKGLLNLTELFKTQNVTIEALLKIKDGQVEDGK